jgi:hypothetical protein
MPNISRGSDKGLVRRIGEKKGNPDNWVLAGIEKSCALLAASDHNSKLPTGA